MKAIKDKKAKSKELEKEINRKAKTDKDYEIMLIEMLEKEFE